MAYSEFDKINGKYAEIELTGIGQKASMEELTISLYLTEPLSMTSVTVMMIGEIPVISVTLSM